SCWFLVAGKGGRGSWKWCGGGGVEGKTGEVVLSRMAGKMVTWVNNASFKSWEGRVAWWLLGSSGKGSGGVCEWWRWAGKWEVGCKLVGRENRLG
nr:hypothetical protein [Tanacetum cinerariifolium]